jgi:hypothetical protein
MNLERFANKTLNQREFLQVQLPQTEFQIEKSPSYKNYAIKTYWGM